MSLISTISSRGHMRFMIKQQGGVNASVFIEFLKRLLTGAERVIFLVVDPGPAQIRKTRAFVESLNGSLRLFYLPPYSPDRNPDELVWKHLKADTVGRMAITSKDDFKEGPFVHAPASKQPGKNLLLLPKTFPQIRRVNV